MANIVTNVAVGKPNVNGAIYRAPLGAELPTDATTPLGSAFTALGYVSEDGATNSQDVDTTEIKAWGGDTVYTGANGKTVTWSFTLIEVLNVDVLKAVYGDDNVTGTIDSGITLTINNDEPDEGVLVIDTVLRGALKRIVIPDGKVTEVGDVTYTDDEVVGYETTVTCMPDRNGNMQYEYIANVEESE